MFVRDIRREIVQKSNMKIPRTSQGAGCVYDTRLSIRCLNLEVRAADIISQE